MLSQMNAQKLRPNPATNMVSFFSFYLFGLACTPTQKDDGVDITELQKNIQKYNWTLAGPPYDTEEVENLIEAVEIADRLTLQPKHKIFGPVTPQNARIYDLMFENINISGGRLLVGEGQLRHEVPIEHNIYVMKKEVSQELYVKLMGRNPSAIKNPKHPVTRIKWSEAVKFANVLSERSSLEPCYQIKKETVRWTGGYHCEGWRLPTETEWDYVALQISQKQEEQRNLIENKIVDLQGGVSEWTWDWFWLKVMMIFPPPLQPLHHNPHQMTSQKTQILVNNDAVKWMKPTKS